MGQIKATQLASAGTSGTLGTVTTSSITPKAHHGYIIGIAQNRSSSPYPTAPTVSGCNLTWTQIATATYTAPNTGGLERVTILYGSGASPTTGTLSITQGGATSQDLGYSITEFSNLVPGSGSIIQTTSNTARDPSSITYSLNAFGSVHNATYGFIYHNGGNNITSDSDFTELDTEQYAHRIETVFADSPQTAGTFSVTGAETIFGVFAELKANFSGAGILMQM